MQRSEEASAGDDVEQQREVQRLLGKCLLRLQQYERLLKALLGGQELSGDVETAKQRLASRVESLRAASLGTLVKEFFGGYALAEGSAASAGWPDTEDEPNKVTFRTRMTIEMPEARLEEERLALKELVAMRNDLVHYFVERYDLWNVERCMAARVYLTDCYASIDRHFGKLVEWARGADEARTLAASLMQSQVLTDMLINGILPDGAVDWPAAGIVSALREAAKELSVDGWTPLDPAIGWLAELHPEQVPAKYRCVSWPQVLHEARVFQFEYREDANGRKHGWYRERHI